jgi:hypothetical protein
MCNKPNYIRRIQLKIVKIIIILILGFILFSYKNIIFQEGNPLPVIYGIIRLNDSKTYVKINDNPITYITKTNNKDELFSYIEKENNVDFAEQMGSGYIFKGENKNIIITSRQYTRFYQIWKYSEQEKSSY